MTPTRLYPLHCALYLCTPTLTRRQLQALVALFHALVSDISFQFLQCSLHWLQLLKLLKLPTSLRSHNFVIAFFLLEVDRSYHNTQFWTRLFYCLIFLIVFLAQFSTLGSAHRLYWLLLFNPVCPFLLLCVSRPTNSLFCPIPIPFHVSPCTILPYSGYHFLFFLGRLPCTPLEFANFLWTFKHVS